MKKTIPIITSAPTIPALPGLDLYDSYDLISRRHRIAPLVTNAAKIIQTYKFPFDTSSIQKIYCYTRGQTLATARLFALERTTNKAKIIPTPLLAGVKFSMRSLISKQEFKQLGYEQAFKKARRQFVIKLFKNQLLESLGSVIKKINKLKVLLQKDPKNTLVIGHSFFVKLMEIYCYYSTGFHDLKSLLHLFDPSQKPYKPLEGFNLHFMHPLDRS